MIELMVTVAVLAILVAIGLPSFQGSMRSNSVATGTNEFIASIALARSEAIRSPGGAGICASEDGATCGASWNDGWIVWNDLDANGSPGGDDDRILRYVQGLPRLNITTDDPASTTVIFDNRGSPDGAFKFTVQPVTCPEGQLLVREIEVTRVGQTRTEKVACP